MEQSILSVSQLNQYVKELMEVDPLLQNVFVRGEISNYKKYPSGHHYFSLKDEGGVLRCVLFRGNASSLRFQPENGMTVIAEGRVGVFPRDGQYQLYVATLTPDGIGALSIAYEQLKKKLMDEGLFDEGRKKEIPRFPRQIALITSPAGAAVRDMLRILKKRWPLTRVLIIPVRVQGEEAAGEIVQALQYVNEKRLGDLIITGRGGGSIEDLWAFNEEIVARAIAESVIPVISAVGHEPDVTISDFVADLRAATPSNAAELAVPEQTEVRVQLDHIRNRMQEALKGRFMLAHRRLDGIRERRVVQDPLVYLQEKRMRLDFTIGKLTTAGQTVLGGQKERFLRLVTGLEAMSPLKVLSRGYSIVRRSDGSVVKEAVTVLPGEQVSVRLMQGSLDCTVDRILEE